MTVMIISDHGEKKKTNKTNGRPAFAELQTSWELTSRYSSF